jgi:hypothetical protein
MTNTDKLPEPDKLPALSKKMAHELSNLLYLTKDDFFCSDQWQAAMDALDNYINELNKDKHDKP